MSPVIGRQECGRFGAWDATNVARVFLELGPSMHALDLGAFSASGTASHENRNHSFSVPSGTFHTRTPLFGMSLRGGAFVNRWLYVGGQLDISGAAMQGPAITDGTLTEVPTGVAMFDFGAVAGAMWQAGPITLRGEVLAGIDVMGLLFSSHLGACDGPGSAMVAAARIEPRVALEARVTPWTSIGVMGGTNALAVEDWSASVYLRWSLRSYDGMRL